MSLVYIELVTYDHQCYFKISIIYKIFYFKIKNLYFEIAKFVRDYFCNVKKICEKWRKKNPLNNSFGNNPSEKPDPDLDISIKLDPDPTSRKKPYPDPDVCSKSGSGYDPPEKLDPGPRMLYKPGS